MEVIKKILYLDLDGVVANFDKAIKDICPELETSDRFENYEARSIEVDRIVSQNPHIFQNLEPIEGAIDAVNKLFDLYDVYFLSTPMWDIPESFMGKRIWVEKHFGEKVNRRLILTHRKDLAIGDYLVDDRMKNGAGHFKGEFIHFGTDRFPDWKTTLEYLMPCFNYKCKKCGSTYINLKKQLDYSNCIVEKPITREKCNGELIPF